MELTKSKFCVICSALLIVSGFGLMLASPIILKTVIALKMILTPSSPIYDAWKHFPELVPMDFYFFNWTNPEDIYNNSIKPKFEEVGPYQFMVDLQRDDITWNTNGTVTYRQKKYWYYKKNKNNGNLEDKVTVPNTIALGAAHVARTWPYLVRRGLSVTLNRISPTVHVTHSVDDLLFKGYPDRLMKIARTLPFLVGKNIPPWDRFGWFYKRNGSSDMEGTYNMGTGIDSVFGKLYRWNYWDRTPYLHDSCAKIDGSTGDRFQFDPKFIKVFSPEACRPVTLQYVGMNEFEGMTGYRYIMDDYMLDNGTKHTDNECFCDGECRPSGIFNVSSCRSGAPAFGSLPHFHRADPYYNNLVEGLRPEKGKHDFSIIVEPNTGIPLEAKIRLQVNLMVHDIPGVSLFENISEAFIPVMWFDYRVRIPENLLPNIKQLLLISTVCIAVGIIFVLFGILVIFVVCFIQKRKKLSRANSYVNIPLKPVKQETVMKELLK